MNTRILGAGALVAGVIALAVVLLTAGRDDGYTVDLRISDALGLRNGSRIVAGGVTVGRVHLSLGAGDKVVAKLAIDPQYAPVGRNASATVTSVNLLGEKSLELDPGNRRDPAPSGSTLAHARVTPSTDLDQILDVLDTDTRNRLTILVNAAGQAFTGRRADIAEILGTLPSGLKDGTDLLQRVDGNHRTLADLVAKSDRFVATLTRNRRALADTLDTFGRAAETAQTRRPQLRQTLRELPGTLQTAQRFLEDLRATAVPLGPAARQLSAAAGPLDGTLAQVGPFTRAATPTLDQAIGVAPSLTRLADGATPVVRRAVPTLRTLASFSSALAPISTMLGRSADNIVGTAANWAHAIQGRDSLSHVFRAEVAVSPQTAEQLVDRLLAQSPGAAKAGGGRHAASPAAKGPPRPQAPAVPAPVKKVTEPLVTTVQGVLDRLGAGTGGDRPRTGGDAVSSLLDYLLHP